MSTGFMQSCPLKFIANSVDIGHIINQQQSYDVVVAISTGQMYAIGRVFPNQFKQWNRPSIWRINCAILWAWATRLKKILRTILENAFNDAGLAKFARQLERGQLMCFVDDIQAHVAAVGQNQEHNCLDRVQRVSFGARFRNIAVIELDSQMQGRIVRVERWLHTIGATL